MRTRLVITSSQLIVVWKSLHTNDELGVIDGPGVPIMVLSKPLHDLYEDPFDSGVKKSNEEAEATPATLVWCLTQLGVGLVDKSHVQKAV